jgi:predicted nucleic acid-binding protein
MIRFALDSNIVSYYLKNNQTVINKIETEIQNGNECIITPIVYYEVKRGLTASHAEVKLKAFEKMYSIDNIGIIDTETLDRAILIYTALRKKGITVDDSDILIAAYCMMHNLTLVTNNLKHFDKIEGLNTVNWTE